MNMPMDFICRMHTPADIDALIRFWGENSGWGAIERELWEHRFLNTPLGPAAFALAIEENSGEILGQFGFIPSQISVDGALVRAYRPVATIVREDIRNTEGFGILQLLIYQMYMHASEVLGSQGAALIHIVPDPRWLRLFQMMPFFQSVTRSLYTLTLPLNKPIELPAAITLSPLAYADPRIDELWEKAKGLYRSIVVRNALALSWKNSHASFDLYGVEREGHLIGLFSAIVKGKEKKWQLCDVLTADADESLELALRAACQQAQTYVQNPAHQADNIDHIAALATPLMEEKLLALGFEKINYGVSLVVHVLDNSLDTSAVAPEQWYLTPNE
jgi:hypothetical protein